jgi:hypothetical protein
MANCDFSDLGAICVKLDRMANPDPTPLMVKIETEIVEDNRYCVLHELDKHGQPYTHHVTYRPVQPKGGKPSSGNWTRRREEAHRAMAHLRVDVNGPPGNDDNLTSAQYRRLTGPDTAPRREYSRIIKNLHTGHGRDSSAGYVWYAEGMWFDFFSRKGYPILEALLRRWPRDGLSPRGVQKCVRHMETWGREMMAGIWG